MIFKIENLSLKEVSALFTAVSSPDNYPQLDQHIKESIGDIQLYEGNEEKSMMALVQIDGDLKQEKSGVDRYSVRIRLAEYYCPHDHDGGASWAVRKPIPAEWMLRLFNAIGRFPHTLSPVPSVSRFEIAKLLHRYAAFIHDSTHCPNGLKAGEDAYHLIRSYLRGETTPDTFIEEWAKVTGQERKPAVVFAEDIRRIMADEQRDEALAEAPPRYLPLTPGFLTDFHSLISLINERDEMAVREWIKGFVHAYSEGDMDYLQRYLNDPIDDACALSHSFGDNPAATRHFLNLRGYFQRNCLGDESA